MRRRDALLAVAVVSIWGVNFVAIEVGLKSLPPLFFVALRFLLTAVPAVLVVPRPSVGWRPVVALGLLMCVGQFGLLFVAMSLGMPAGLASVVLQSQALFTALFAAVVLRERPGRVQLVGLMVAVGGLALIATERGGEVPFVALLLAIGGAVCWGAANVVTRAARPPRPLSLLIYSSMVAPLPLAGLSLLIEGPGRDGAALRHLLDGRVIISMTYVVVLATLVGFGAWYRLLDRYPSSSVAPFSLLVPVTGLTSAWLVLGEVPTPAQLLGSAIAIGGVGLVVAGGRVRTDAGHLRRERRGWLRALRSQTGSRDMEKVHPVRNWSSASGTRPAYGACHRAPPRAEGGADPAQPDPSSHSPEQVPCRLFPPPARSSSSTSSRRSTIRAGVSGTTRRRRSRSAGC